MSEYPSIGQQAKNLIQSAANIVKNPYLVSEDIKQARLNICSLCEHHDDTLNRCKECGCFLNAKVIFSGNSCPIGKWGIVQQEQSVPEIDVEKVSADTMIPGRDYPNFPRIGNEIGQVYEWKGASWTWNGERWDFNFPDPS